ncbi:MAG: PAS domain-containing protein [Fibrobacteria bacterium]
MKADRMMGAAIAQSDMATCITDAREILLQVNDAFCRLYKYPDPQSLIGMPVSIIRSPATPQGLYADMWKTIAGGGIWRGRMNNMASDGTEVHIHLTISPIRDEGGVSGYLGISLDKAQQATLENQLRNADKLLANSALGSSLAHVLNNPLASILLDAEHLRDCLADIIASPAAAQAEQAASSIIECAEKMREVLENLLRAPG